MHRHCAHGAGLSRVRWPRFYRKQQRVAVCRHGHNVRGRVSNGVYTTDSYSQLKHVCVDSQTRILFVEDEEQLDKFLEIEKELPLVKKVVVFDDDGLKTFRHPKVMFMDELYELGEENFEKLHNEFDVRLDNVRPADTAILVYTSGTTGPPKGAMLTHQNLLFQARNAGSWVGDGAREEIISILPLCHIAERTFSVFLPLNFKWIVNFVESPETSFENTMEVSRPCFSVCRECGRKCTPTP